MRKQSFRGNVFVANLPQGFTDADLARAFDPFGLVIGALLARDLKSGAAKTHGLVDIAPQRAADAAVAAMNGMKLFTYHCRYCDFWHLTRRPTSGNAQIIDD